MNVLADALLSFYPEVSPMDFYRDIFPLGELDDYNAFSKNKYTAIAIEVTKDKIVYENGRKREKVNRYTVTDDLDNIDLLLYSDNFCIIAPISYAGKSRKSENARFMYALCVELDNLVDVKGNHQGLKSLIHQWSEKVHWLPKPTYIVASGNGVHLYYIFQKPIPLFKNVAASLSKYKEKLTTKLWNRHTTYDYSKEKIQQESIFQAFRMVGTKTKSGDVTRAFLVGEPVSVDYMNSFLLPQDKNCAITEVYKSDLTLTQAKQKYPEWYDKRIVNGEKRGRWVANRAVYDWWLRRITNEAVVGHRFYCLMMLAVYAIKCDISADELESDMFKLLPIFEERTYSEDNHFTVKDVMEAYQIFEDKGFVTYPLNSIAHKSGLEIKKNKRNGRKQDVHIRYMNNQRIFKVELGECTNGGRPKGSGTAKDKVYDWRKKNPKGRKIDCERETGLSRPTVLKWWDYVPSKYVDVSKTDFVDIIQISKDIVEGG